MALFYDNNLSLSLMQRAITLRIAYSRTFIVAVASRAALTAHLLACQDRSLNFLVQEHLVVPYWQSVVETAQAVVS
jgi:hypothetical protein